MENRRKKSAHFFFFNLVYKPKNILKNGYRIRTQERLVSVIRARYNE